MEEATLSGNEGDIAPLSAAHNDTTPIPQACLPELFEAQVTAHPDFARWHPGFAHHSGPVELVA